MTASSKPEGTAVARVKPALPADVQAAIEYNRQKNAVIAAIRGTIWGKEISPDQVRAVAQYAREMHIDPVRHIEVLGGRIYLTAEFYREKGAKYIHDGTIIPQPTEYIHADPRLDELIKSGGEMGKWAQDTKDARLRQRIEFGVPEGAKAAAVVRFTMRDGGGTIEGCNWCGGTAKRDPVGDAEPTKTAESRAERRAWRKVVKVIPDFEREVGHVEARATIVEDEVAQIAGAEPKALPRTTQIAGQEEAEPMERVPLAPMQGDMYENEDEAA